MTGDEQDLADAQRAHWQSTYLAHPGMYGEKPSAPAVHAATVFRAAGARDVLELGAGHGRDALYFAREGFTVQATDFSATGLEQLRRSALAQGTAGQVTTAVHDVREALPLPDASVDAVFAHMLLCMALSTDEILTLGGEIRRVGSIEEWRCRLSLGADGTAVPAKAMSLSFRGTWGLVVGRWLCFFLWGASMRLSKSKADLYAAIRRDHRAGMSMRALQRKYGVTWQTVRKALDLVWPEPRKKLPPRPTRLDPYKPLIDEMLRRDLDAPPKQRHTAKRVFDRLLDEYTATGISYQMVRGYIATRRGEIRHEAGRGPSEVFVPQTHLPGTEAEVDFGDVHIVLAGVATRCYLFSFRLSYSGKAVHRVFASCGQEAFFEGHVHALTLLGGAPRGKVRYDNLKAAVAQVLGFARHRKESERWTAFRTHWGIESFYCRPGLEGAHEKGGVEGQIGYFRRNHFVPVPEVASLAELNEMVDRWDLEDEGRRIRSRARTVGEYFAVEAPLLKPLPTELFETGRLFTPQVDRYSQIAVQTNRYSVPVRLIGRTVRVMLHANHLVVYDQGHEVARHERLSAKASSRLELDHYLEALIRKPGAFPGATALEQARSAGKFTPVHDDWWTAARASHGDKDGTKALIEVLLLGRHMSHEHIVAGLATALRAGAFTADAVALEARKAAEADEPMVPAPARVPLPEPPGRRATVTFLADWRMSHLPPDTRPLPSVAPYDQLLRHRRQGGDTASQGEAP